MSHGNGNGNEHLDDGAESERSKGNPASDDERLDTLLADVRTISKQGAERDKKIKLLDLSIASLTSQESKHHHKLASAVGAVAATAEATAERVDEVHGIVLRADGNAARAADAVERMEKILGVDIDPRASIVDMTPEELRQLEQSGLVPQVRTLIHSMRSARRDARLAFGGVSLVTVATVFKILVELFQ